MRCVTRFGFCTDYMYIRLCLLNRCLWAPNSAIYTAFVIFAGCATRGTRQRTGRQEVGRRDSAMAFL